MADAFIYDAVRTPRGRGKKDGSLHEVPTPRLAAKTLEALRDRNGLDTSKVDDIIFGCVDPVGEAGAVIPKSAAFEAGYDYRAPGMQINRFCASGLDSVNLGAAKIAQGAEDIVIAGGVESARCARWARNGVGSALPGTKLWHLGPFLVQFGGQYDRKEHTGRLDTKPLLAVVQGMLTDFNQTVERFAVNEGFKVTADQNVRRRLTRFGVSLDPNWVVRTGHHCITDIGFKHQIIAPAIEVHGDKWRVIYCDTDLLNRRDQKVILALFLDDPREQLHQPRPPDGRALIEPRPVPRDPHVQITAERRVPKMHWRQR